MSQNKIDNNQPSLFDENKQEQKARLIVEKFGGIFSGAFDPTKSAKELKRELLKKVEYKKVYLDANIFIVFLKKREKIINKLSN